MNDLHLRPYSLYFLYMMIVVLCAVIFYTLYKLFLLLKAFETHQQPHLTSILSHTSSMQKKLNQIQTRFEAFKAKYLPLFANIALIVSIYSLYKESTEQKRLKSLVQSTYKAYRKRKK